MHIPDGYLSPETCGVFGAAMVPVWVDRRPARAQDREEPLRAAARARRGVQLPRDDVQRADPRRHDGARGRRRADRGAARTVGRGDRGEHRAADPGAVLRRRRRARVRREHASTWRSSCRWSATRVYCVVAPERPLTSPRRPFAAGLGRVRRAERGRAVRRDRVRHAARRCSTPRTARRSTRRSISRRRSRRWRSRTSRSRAWSSSR